MEYVIETHEVSKKYKTRYAVNKVSIRVKKGAIYGLIGRNGAGKTSLIKMLVGLSSKDEGTIKLFGEEDNLKMRSRIGCSIENPCLYPKMSAYENLEYYRKLFGILDKDIVDKTLQIIGLDNVGNKKTRNFSLGMKQRLALGIALLGNPDVLILDEPLNGLDPTGIRELRELFLKLNREKGVTIIISSHILGELSRVATDYGVIDKGTLVEQFSKEELEHRCRRCIKIKSLDTTKVCAILETKLKTKEYDVLQDGTVRLFEYIEEPEKVNRVLFEHGASIQSFGAVSEDLEDYFMQLMNQ